MSEKNPNEKFLQVREFGDSLYVPLTTFLKKLGSGRDRMVRVNLDEKAKAITITPE